MRPRAARAVLAFSGGALLLAGGLAFVAALLIQAPAALIYAAVHRALFIATEGAWTVFAMRVAVPEVARTAPGT